MDQVGASNLENLGDSIRTAGNNSAGLVAQSVGGGGGLAGSQTGNGNWGRLGAGALDVVDDAEPSLTN